MRTTQHNYPTENTTVVLLAAGRGERMMPLTASTPKPLLKVGDSSLIEHHLSRLAKQGFRMIVINLAYFGDMIQQTLGDGSQFNLDIQYSDESATGALETAGGLRQALPLINSDPFLVVNADIWTDFAFEQLLTPLETQSEGRLVMVPNPQHNLSGDFGFDKNNKIIKKPQLISKTYTFSGIALYKKSIFTELTKGKQALLPIFNQLIEQDKMEGLVFDGVWTDVGTPERLEQLNSLV